MVNEKDERRKKKRKFVALQDALAKSVFDSLEIKIVRLSREEMNLSF